MSVKESAPTASAEAVAHLDLAHGYCSLVSSSVAHLAEDTFDRFEPRRKTLQVFDQEHRSFEEVEVSSLSLGTAEIQGHQATIELLKTRGQDGEFTSHSIVMGAVLRGDLLLPIARFSEKVGSSACRFVQLAAEFKHDDMGIIMTDNDVTIDPSVSQEKVNRPKALDVLQKIFALNEEQPEPEKERIDTDPLEGLVAALERKQMFEILYGNTHNPSKREQKKLLKNAERRVGIESISDRKTGSLVGFRAAAALAAMSAYEGRTFDQQFRRTILGLIPETRDSMLEFVENLQTMILDPEALQDSEAEELIRVAKLMQMDDLSTALLQQAMFALERKREDLAKKGRIELPKYFYRPGSPETSPKVLRKASEFTTTKYRESRNVILQDVQDQKYVLPAMPRSITESQMRAEFNARMLQLEEVAGLHAAAEQFGLNFPHSPQREKLISQLNYPGIQKMHECVVEAGPAKTPVPVYEALFSEKGPDSTIIINQKTVAPHLEDVSDPSHVDWAAKEAVQQYVVDRRTPHGIAIVKADGSHEPADQQTLDNLQRFF